MRILTLFLVLFISVSVYAGDSKSVEQWINEAYPSDRLSLNDREQESLLDGDDTYHSDRLSSNQLDVDRITLSTFHAIKRSLETLEYSIDYSTKIVCNDNFGNIVLTIYDKGLGAKHGSLLSRVRDVLRKTPKETPLFFDLYVELVFPNAPYSDPLFLIPAFGNSYKRIFTASDYYQRDIFPYYQPLSCSICGGGSTLTKYGKLSHVYGCRYTLIGIRNNTLRTGNVPKSRKVQSKRFRSTGRSKAVSVRGYYRKDGTYVRPHKRRAPRR